MPEQFVFDTNTIIRAALFRQSFPRQALDLALSKGILLVSEATMLELMDVFLREKFDRYLSRDKREIFLTTLLRQVHMIAIVESIIACRDSKDDKFLEVAVNGLASVIVTGDDDLLVLHPYRTIAIMNSRRFVEDTQ